MPPNDSENSNYTNEALPPASTANPGTKRLHLPRLFIGLVILLLILAFAGVLVAHLHKSKPVTTSHATVQQAQVSITDNGFSPATLQARTGTQVTWTNTDSAPHQVAADPYPKNNGIPNFDSTVILQKSDTFSFVFEKAGTYTYHDQKNPLNFHGTIVVR